MHVMIMIVNIMLPHEQILGSRTLSKKLNKVKSSEGNKKELEVQHLALFSVKQNKRGAVKEL